jgi:hypothetical protein
MPPHGVFLHEGFRRRGGDPVGSHRSPRDGHARPAPARGCTRVTGLPQSKVARGPSGRAASQRATCSPSSACWNGPRAWASLGPLDATASRPRARRSGPAQHLAQPDGASRRGRRPATGCRRERRPLLLDRRARNRDSASRVGSVKHLSDFVARPNGSVSACLAIPECHSACRPGSLYIFRQSQYGYRRRCDEARVTPSPDMSRMRMMASIRYSR